MLLGGWMPIVGLLALCQGVPDTPVSCVYGGICVLPCAFQTADELVIHWIQKLPDKRMVHSYHSERDQLGNQDDAFRNRTSLSRDQITNGNASLKLMGVRIQDEGRYQCYTSNTQGNKESFDTVTVKAPVVDVTIELVGDRVTCTSRGIYPKPTLTWSTSPLTDLTFHNSTTVNQNAEKLFDISSTLTNTANDTQRAYICSVGMGGKGKTITLRQLPPVLGYGSADVTIPCQAPNSTLKDFSVTWRFNHKDTILNEGEVTDQWKERVKGVSESGDLQLSASSEKLEGDYMCELSHADDTYVTYTYLKINQEPHVTGDVTSVAISVVVVMVVAIIATIIISLLIRHFKTKRRKPDSDNGVV